MNTLSQKARFPAASPSVNTAKSTAGIIQQRLYSLAFFYSVKKSHLRHPHPPCRHYALKTLCMAHIIISYSHSTVNRNNHGQMVHPQIVQHLRSVAQNGRAGRPRPADAARPEAAPYHSGESRKTCRYSSCKRLALQRWQRSIGHGVQTVMPPTPLNEKRQLAYAAASPYDRESAHPLTRKAVKVGQLLLSVQKPHVNIIPKIIIL